jgi:hypothetical protein
VEKQPRQSQVVGLDSLHKNSKPVLRVTWFDIARAITDLELTAASPNKHPNKHPRRFGMVEMAQHRFTPQIVWLGEQGQRRL